MQALRPDRVAIYIRWSTEDQGEGTTLAVQSEACRHYVLSQGWQVRDDLIFVDDGHSGGHLERPALTRLRAAVGQGAVDCVVVYKLDRLSRSVMDTVNLVLGEWEGVCHVKSTREPVDTTNPAGKVFFYMLASYAEWERSTIRERTFSGKVRRALEGRNPGMKPPFGYRAATGTGAFTPDPGEAAIVRLIFKWYLAGLGFKAIVRRLNAEGYVFRGGRPWHESTVQQIISRPLYCGDLTYGRRVRNLRHGKVPGAPQYVQAPQPLALAPGAVPAIISRADFAAAQALRQAKPSVQNGRSGRACTSPHLLTGVGRCRCGAPLAGRAPHPRRGTRGWYLCDGRRKKGPGVCPGADIPQDALDGLVVQKIRELYGHELGRARWEAALRRRSGEQYEEVTAAREQVQQALARLDEQERRVRTLLRQGTITGTEYRQIKADIDHERQDLTARRDKLDAASRTHRQREQEAAQARQALLGVQRWEVLDPVQRKQVVRHLVQGLTAHRARGSDHIDCEITWRFPADRPQADRETRRHQACTAPGSHMFAPGGCGCSSPPSA